MFKLILSAALLCCIPTSKLQDNSSQSVYEFTEQSDFTLTEYDKKGKTKEEFSGKIYVNENSLCWGVEVEVEGAPSFSIIDNENEEMIVLVQVEGMKTGMKQKLKTSSYKPSETSGKEEENLSFKKSGQTKKIAGLECEEYLSENEKEKYSFWITQEKDLGFTNAFFGYQAQTMAGNNLEFPAGMIMEVTTLNKKNDAKSVFQITDIKEDISKKVDLSNYNIMSF